MANSMRVMNKSVVIRMCLVLSVLCGADAWKWNRFKFLIGHDLLPANPETSMTTTQIIAYRGYPFEIHHVTTDDGYILELHRIPRGQNEAADPTVKKRAVFLQHGLLGTSADWVINFTNNSLAFILADKGYDVWLGNARGNTYSRKNVRLDPSQEEFWNFSWDEMGKYDIPAVITYILSVTGNAKLNYVGHSMGTSMFWVAMITRPELNDKIENMFALAPVASLANMRSVIRYLAPFQSTIQLGFRMLGGRVFLDNNEPISSAQRQFCDTTVHHASICRNILLILGGSDTYDFNLSIIPVIYGHDPAGTSIRTVAQFAQNYNSGETFIPYNYGLWENLLRYGSIRPPPYNLSKITAPVYLFWGQNDYLATPEDTEWLAGQLPNLQASLRVPYSMFNHFDFIWALDVAQLLYDPMLSLLPPANL